jgi:hypothetical protein
VKQNYFIIGQIITNGFNARKIKSRKARNVNNLLLFVGEICEILNVGTYIYYK